MSLRGRMSLLGATAVLFAACSSGGATTAPATPAPTTAPPASTAPESMAPESMAPESAAPIAGGLLDKVMKAGKIVMSTDPQYPPQSSLKTDGTYEGFDIDVGTEIAKRLGVTSRSRRPTGTSSPPAPGAAAGTSASAR